MATVGPRYNPGFWYWWPFGGFYDFGPAPVPPLIPIAGMTDRFDGVTVWYIGYDPALGRLFLTNTVPTSFMSRIKVYGPFDGPAVGNYGLRIGVSSIPLSGLPREPHIVVDDPLQQYTTSGAGPWAYEKGSNQFAALIFAVVNNGNFNFFDHLAWTLVAMSPFIGPQPVGSPPVFPIVIPGPGPATTTPDEG